MTDPHVMNAIILVGVCILILSIVASLLNKFNLWALGSAYSVVFISYLVGTDASHIEKAKWAIGASAAIMILYKFAEFCARELEKHGR